MTLTSSDSGSIFCYLVLTVAKFGPITLFVVLHLTDVSPITLPMALTLSDSGPTSSFITGSIIFSVVTKKISNNTNFLYNKKAFVSFIIKLDTKIKGENKCFNTKISKLKIKI
ncbi:hypothetical protein AC806_10330 [Tetragenococcus halophilus]|nr:hypothetical protein AC806_10330 [Tetragenococcus halophilus]